MNVEFEYELEVGNHELTVLVQADVDAFVDDNYGADADGNRGVKQGFCDVESIKIVDGRNNDLTKKIEKNYKPDMEIIESLIIEKAGEE